jgi:N-acetylglucosamine-6-phosphate deacetylase
MKAIKNVKLILKDSIQEDTAIVFNEKIVDITNVKKLQEYNLKEIIDGKGNYLSPGFIDIHIHGCGGHDVMDYSKESLDCISKRLVSTGVTSFLPTTITMDMKGIEKALDNIKENMGKVNEAQILGCYLEGPFINKYYKGAHNDNYIMEPDFKKIKDYKDIIKIVTVAPELNGAREFIKECINNNIVVSIGHSNATFEEAIESINLGAKHITHTYNAMSPLHHRKPGVVGAAMLGNVSCELIVDNIHVHPAAQEILLRLKGYDNIILITDAMRACLLKDGKYDLGGQEVAVKREEARLSDGTIAGSLLTLNKGIRNFIKNTGIDIYNVVKMASLNPARLLGVDCYKGSIEIDKDADLVIINEEFDVMHTLVKGMEAYKI